MSAIGSQSDDGGFGSSLGSTFDQVRRGLVVQWRVLHALMIRESGIRRGQSSLIGWLLGSVEPLVMIATLGVLFSIINHTPSYGASMLLFVGTGVFPLYVFLYTSIRVREPAMFVMTGRYPLEMPLDEIAVHSVLQLISTLIVAIGFFGGMALFGVSDAIPSDLGALFGSVTTLFLFGLGVGVLNGAITRIFPFWSILWSGMVRMIYHFSGLYFVVDYFNPTRRFVFQINPVTHGLNWFRHAFYPFYPDTSADPGYVVIWAMGALFVGLSAERILRGQILRGERIY